MYLHSTRSGRRKVPPLAQKLRDARYQPWDRRSLPVRPEVIKPGPWESYRLQWTRQALRRLIKAARLAKLGRPAQGCARRADLRQWLKEVGVCWKIKQSLRQRMLRRARFF
jgi:hypothetical protein